MRFRLQSWTFILAGLLAGCGGVTSTSTPPCTTCGGGASLPAADHVVLVILENHGFAQVIGNSAMPYLNSLATQHALAANYFADAHPSIGNYFMLTTGKMESTVDTFSGTITDDNLVRALTGAGKSWKAYFQSIPSAGYTGGDVYPYLRRHDPFSYLSDVQNSQAEAANIVPFSQLASDEKAGMLPAFIYLMPDAEHDAHDCPDGTETCADDVKLAAADHWLQTNLDPLINNPAMANSVFLITFDEALDSDTRAGGGQVPLIVAGTHVKAGFQSMTMFQHQSTLRLILDLLRVSDLPGAAAGAPAMNEFFQ